MYDNALLARLEAKVEGMSPAQRELVRAGSWEATLEVATAESLSRLDAELGVPVIPVARLGALGPPRGVESGARGDDDF